jgi:hypothetical protein
MKSTSGHPVHAFYSSPPKTARRRPFPSVLACCPGRVRALEVHTSLAGDLPEDAAVHDRADVLLLHHAVGGPEQDVRRRPLEHLAAEADEVVHDLLGHDRAPDVALREAVAVRA